MKRINVSDMIYETIIDEFLNDEIDFGDKFIETEYANKLNVSRTPLREAIKKLEHEGLIVRLQNGRLKFLDITQENIIEIFNIRIALENMLIEQSLNNKVILDKLNINVSSAEKYLANNEFEMAREKIREFTSILYSNLGFEYTTRLLNKNNILLSKLKKRTLQPTERTKLAVKEHREIYQAMVNKDLPLAFELNKRHLLGARDIILLNTSF